MRPLLHVVMLLFAIQPVWAQQTGHAAKISGAIKVATFMDFPPFIADTEPGFGILSVIVRESFVAAGLEAEFPLVPWRRSYRAVKRGEYSASYSWAYSDERARDFELSAPIFSISNMLLTTYADLENWQQLETQGQDGARPILCVPHGWKIAEEIAELIARGKLQQISPGHPRFCLELIRANRTNIIYMPRMTAYYHLNAIRDAEAGTDQRPWPALYGMEVPSGIANTQHVIFTRDAAGAALKDRFNAGFAHLVSSGRYHEILETYLANYSPVDRQAIREEQIKAGILPQQ